MEQPKTEAVPDSAASAVKRRVMPPELAAMLAEAYIQGFADGMGTFPDWLPAEAIKRVASMPVLGKIADVDIQRVRIMKRAIRALGDE